MKTDQQRFLRRKGRRKEHGQVLILAVLAVIVLVTVLIILFDIQQVIRRKVMVMSAVDAAAQTGAVWQKHTLNLIGEMNLIKACTVLISDSVYGVGKNPNDFLHASIDQNSSAAQIAAEVKKAQEELEMLKTSANMLTEMQVRVAFVGPLIGFGAAQQAAKNNGLTYNLDCNAYLRDLHELILDDDVYGNPQLAPQVYYGYAWRYPYGRMINALLGLNDKGIAVGTNVKHIGMPGFLSDTLPGRSLDKKIVMDAIAGNDWCILQKLLDEKFTYTGKWWGDLKLKEEKNFLGGSEILPVNVTYKTGEQIYEVADEKGYLDRVIADKGVRGQSYRKLTTAYNSTDLLNSNGTVNWNDTDLAINPLPAITWGVFDESRWCSYNQAGVDIHYWSRYLRSNFKPGMDYHSGAVSYFSVMVPNGSYLKSMNLPAKMLGRSSSSVNNPVSGKAPSSMGDRMDHYTKIAAYHQAQSSAQSIRFNATAKPFGVLKGADNVMRHPFAAGMVLPVFTKVALIPVALEVAEGIAMEDYAWIIYLTKYLPALGKVDHIDDLADGSHLDPKYYNIVKEAGYIDLLKKLEDPAWRAEGRAWLEAEATGHDVFDQAGRKIGHVVDTVNRDHCNEWPSGNSFVKGPGALH